MNARARQLVEQLQLAPLPLEGGWFRQTWCSAAGSAIYFLLAEEDMSALHRLRATETWHFYAGDPVLHWQLDPATGISRWATLGSDVLAGQVAQLVVPENIWQGARPIAGGAQGFSLLGCTLAPPWDEKLFELAEREILLRAFPAAAAHIRGLTR